MSNPSPVKSISLEELNALQGGQCPLCSRKIYSEGLMRQHLFKNHGIQIREPVPKKSGTGGSRGRASPRGSFSGGSRVVTRSTSRSPANGNHTATNNGIGYFNPQDLKRAIRATREAAKNEKGQNSEANSNATWWVDPSSSDDDEAALSGSGAHVPNSAHVPNTRSNRSHKGGRGLRRHHTYPIADLPPVREVDGEYSSSSEEEDENVKGSPKERVVPPCTHEHPFDEPSDNVDYAGAVSEPDMCYVSEDSMSVVSFLPSPRRCQVCSQAHAEMSRRKENKKRWQPGVGYRYSHRVDILLDEIQHTVDEKVGGVGAGERLAKAMHAEIKKLCGKLDRELRRSSLLEARLREYRRAARLGDFPEIAMSGSLRDDRSVESVPHRSSALEENPESPRPQMSVVLSRNFRVARMWSMRHLGGLLVTTFRLWFAAAAKSKKRRNVARWACTWMSRRCLRQAFHTWHLRVQASLGLSTKHTTNFLEASADPSNDRAGSHRRARHASLTFAVTDLQGLDITPSLADAVWYKTTLRHLFRTWRQSVLVEQQYRNAAKKIIRRSQRGLLVFVIRTWQEFVIMRHRAAACSRRATLAVIRLWRRSGVTALRSWRDYAVRRKSIRHRVIQLLDRGNLGLLKQCFWEWRHVVVSRCRTDAVSGVWTRRLARQSTWMLRHSAFCAWRAVAQRNCHSTVATRLKSAKSTISELQRKTTALELSLEFQKLQSGDARVALRDTAQQRALMSASVTKLRQQMSQHVDKVRLVLERRSGFECNRALSRSFAAWRLHCRYRTCARSIASRLCGRGRGSRLVTSWRWWRLFTAGQKTAREDFRSQLEDMRGQLQDSFRLRDEMSARVCEIATRRADEATALRLTLEGLEKKFGNQTTTLKVHLRRLEQDREKTKAAPASTHNCGQWFTSQLRGSTTPSAPAGSSPLGLPTTTLSASHPPPVLKSPRTEVPGKKATPRQLRIPPNTSTGETTSAPPSPTASICSTATSAASVATSTTTGSYLNRFVKRPRTPSIGSPTRNPPRPASEPATPSQPTNDVSNHGAAFSPATTTSITSPSTKSPTTNSGNVPSEGASGGHVPSEGASGGHVPSEGAS
eukprot:Rmarinus@m.23753